MSTELEKSLVITDESSDVVSFVTAKQEDEIDWTDDDQAILVRVKTEGQLHVNITRADLVKLVGFLHEVIDTDRDLNGFEHE